MEEAIVILGASALIITVIAIPFLTACNFMMNRWDGNDKSKQYNKE